MTLLPAGVKVHVAFGYIDMRKGINGLAMLVQGVLRQDPFSGHLFVFRGRKANLIKIVFWDGTVERRPGWDADAELGAVVDAD
jgi:transposase